MTRYFSWRKPVLTFVLALVSATMLSGCTKSVPSTKEAEATAACVVAHVGNDRLRAMGESYALSQSSGLSRTDAWQCGDARWRVALSSAYRESVEPAMVAALTRSPVAREGMYAATFGAQFTVHQRVVVGKLGSFFDDARRATLQGMVCQTVEPQAAQVVGRLDLPFAIAVLGVQADIANPAVAQSAATKLLERVNMLMSSDQGATCKVDNGQERFLAYAKEMQQFYQGQHPWAPGCGVRPDGDELKLVCSGVKSAAKP